MAAGTRSSTGDGLSIVTLIVAALAAGGAAILVSQFSESGSAMAAALTAVFVPLLREVFHRPAQALSDVRPRRRSAPLAAAGGGGAAAAYGEPAPATRSTEQTRVAAVGDDRADASVATEITHDDGATRAFGTGAGSHDLARSREPSTDFLGADEAPTDMLERNGGQTGPGLGNETERLPAPADATAIDAEDATRRLEPETAATRRHDSENGSGGRADAAAGVGAAAGAAPLRRRPSPSVRGDAGATSSHRARGAAGRGRASLRRPRVRLAVLTGVLAFAIAAVVLTVPELIAGGSIGGGEGRTTLFSGGSSDSSSDEGSGEGGSATDSGESSGEAGEDPNGSGLDDVPGIGNGASDGEGGSGSGSGGGSGSEPPAPSGGESGGGATEPPSGSNAAPAPTKKPSAPSGGASP